MHYLFAGLFFVSAGGYVFSVANLMYQYRLYFSQHDQHVIKLNYKLSYLMLGITMVMIMSTILMGTHYWLTPILEWVTVFLNMNYFSLLNFTNPFYDSIHPYGEKKY